MSRHDDRSGFEPLPDPEHDPAAAALARALDDDAREVEPADRLADLRARTRDARPGCPAALGAAAAVAAVAAAAVVGVTVFGGDTGGTPPAGSTTAPSQPASANPSPSSSPPASSGSAWIGPVVTHVVPVYYLGRDGDRLALFREFHQASGPAASSPLQLALDAATDPTAVVDPDLSTPWPARLGPLDVRRTGPHEVTVNMPADLGAASGRTAEQARLAVQQLVWTASAVAQDPQLGVRLLIDGRAGKLFGLEPVGGVVHRASPSYTVLGSVWIDVPGEGQAVSSPVTVKGSACVFEATVAWELRQDGRVLRSGSTMASSGCPVRGTWTASLGALPAGTYTVRAYESSPSGQGPDRETTRTFTVR